MSDAVIDSTREPEEREEVPSKRAERVAAAASPSLASMSFEQRLELARRVKHEALQRDGGDDLAYFLKKQLQSDLVRERARKAEREQKAQSSKARSELGYSAWREEEEQRLREAAKAEKPERDVRSEQQRREDDREWRRQDRAHLRSRDSERLAYDEQRRREEEQRARDVAEDARRERDIYWQRRDAQREQLQRSRERLRHERKGREEQHVIDAHLRTSRQQLEEERQTNAASEWSRVLERRQREQTRRLMRAAQQQRTYSVLDLEEGDLKDATEADSAYREGLRNKKRATQLLRRVDETEHEESELARWYTNRALDRYERQRRVVHEIKMDTKPLPIVGDA